MLVLYDRVIVFLLYNIRIASVLLLYVFVLVIQVVLYDSIILFVIVLYNSIIVFVLVIQVLLYDSIIVFVLVFYDTFFDSAGFAFHCPGTCWRFSKDKGGFDRSGKLFFSPRKHQSRTMEQVCTAQKLR